MNLIETLSDKDKKEIAAQKVIAQANLADLSKYVAPFYLKNLEDFTSHKLQPDSAGSTFVDFVWMGNPSHNFEVPGNNFLVRIIRVLALTGMYCLIVICCIFVPNLV